jgi:hypothetical protein
MTRRSKASLEARMAAKSAAHRFGETVQAVFADGRPELLRYSRMIGKLAPAVRAEAERERLIAARCETHGLLEDPAIALIGEGAGKRVAYICPWCSGPDILAQWEREGAS